MLPIFPHDVSIKYDSHKTMAWNNHVKRSGSNKIRILSGYLYPRWTIAVKAHNIDDKTIRDIQGFFALLRGGVKPFLWLDHEDNKVEKELIAIGDGFKKDFQLVRSLGGFVEPITDIKSDTLHVYANGKPVSHEYNDNGMITISTPPEQGVKITADFTYYWRVRLVKDTLTYQHKYINFNELSMEMEVVR